MPVKNLFAFAFFSPVNSTLYCSSKVITRILGSIRIKYLFRLALSEPVKDQIRNIRDFTAVRQLFEKIQDLNPI